MEIKCVFFSTSNADNGIMLALKGMQGSREKPKEGTTPACLCTALLSPPLDHSSTVISQSSSWILIETINLPSRTILVSHFVAKRKERSAIWSSFKSFTTSSTSPACLFRTINLLLCQSNICSITFVLITEWFQVVFLLHTEKGEEINNTNIPRKALTIKVWKRHPFLVESWIFLHMRL